VRKDGSDSDVTTAAALSRALGRKCNIGPHTLMKAGDTSGATMRAPATDARKAKDRRTPEDVPPPTRVAIA
jgi:hypothetical protein